MKRIRFNEQGNKVANARTANRMAVSPKMRKHRNDQSHLACMDGRDMTDEELIRHNSLDIESRLIRVTQSQCDMLNYLRNEGEPYAINAVRVIVDCLMTRIKMTQQDMFTVNIALNGYYLMAEHNADVDGVIEERRERAFYLTQQVAKFLGTTEHNGAVLSILWPMAYDRRYARTLIANNYVANPRMICEPGIQL